MLLLLVLGDTDLDSSVSLSTYPSFVTCSYVVAYIKLPVPGRPQINCNV